MQRARAIQAVKDGDQRLAAQLLSELAPHPATASIRGVLDALMGSPRAGSDLRDLSSAWPEDGCLMQAAAYASLIAGEIDYGITLAERARSVDPTQVQTGLLLGFAQTMKGQIDEAAKTWRSVLSVDAGQPIANAALGAHYLRGGDALLALPLLEAAQESGLDVSTMLPMAYYRAGKLARYLRETSRQGWPLGDNGTLASAERPVDAYKSMLGIEEGKTLVATIATSLGPLDCELFWEDAPVTVANFTALARGTQAYVDPRSGQPGHGPYFDGTVVHRVIPEFMIQMGDPTGTGTGDPGYRFPDELSPALRFDSGGLLAMANSGPSTNGSQFFVTEAETPHLNGRHTIFGRCDAASLERVKTIARTPRDASDKPLQPVVVETIKIESR